MSIARQIQNKLNSAVEGATNELEAIGNEWSSHNDRIVSDWSGKPRFQVRVETTAQNTLDLLIIATGEHAPKWYWTDRGTRPHVIRARRAPNLVFQSGYSARTLPVAKFRQGSGQSVGAFVSKKEVNHPGTEAREFTKTFADDNKQLFTDRIINRVKRELRR